MHIGLIGGIGVVATLVYYQRLVAAIHALDGGPEITIVHAQVHELVSNNFADRRKAQAEIYASSVDRLKAAGCNCAAITSLGGKRSFPHVSRQRRLNLISIDCLRIVFSTRAALAR